MYRVKGKLNDPEIFKFLMQYDLVWVLEVKSVYKEKRARLLYVQQVKTVIIEVVLCSS